MIMTSPIELLVDKACGITEIDKNDMPELTLLALADAAKDWKIFPSVENEYKLREAVEAWETIGG
jgi:hypothetical protein